MPDKVSSAGKGMGNKCVNAGEKCVNAGKKCINEFVGRIFEG